MNGHDEAVIEILKRCPDCGCDLYDDDGDVSCPGCGYVWEDMEVEDGITE